MKAHFRANLTARKRKLLAGVFVLVLIYAVAGFLVLPPIIRAQAVKQLSAQLGRPVSIEKVRINPFVLSIALQGLLIKDLDGEPFVSWDNVYVNFQLSSFLGRAWVFKEIRVVKPYVRVQMNKDRSFNFSDLLARFATNMPAAKTTGTKPVELHVGRLDVRGAAASVTDLTPREPFRRTLGPLTITLDDFRTEPGNKNPYSFTGTTDAGETISWGGYFSLSPLKSAGQLKLYHFDLVKYAPLYQDLVRFQVRDGSVALNCKYQLEFGATNREAAVEDFSCSLRDFKAGVSGDSNNLVEVPLFSVLGANIDLERRIATVGNVWLEGARASIKRNTNDAVNVVELAQPATAATNAPGGILFLLSSVTNAVAQLLNSTNEWSATVSAIAATNCALHLEDGALPHPARLDLSEITLNATNLSNLPGTHLEADFSLRWNTNGAVHIGAEVGFQPTTADLSVDLDRLNLGTMDAYLAPKLNLLIPASEVNLHGTVRLRPQVNNLPVVSFTGDASLDHFQTVDAVFGEELVRWDTLQFNGMVANLNPPLVAIREIDLDNAYARVIVETNHTINLANVLKGAEGAARGVTNTVNPVPAATSGAASNTPLQISIGAIVITNTAVNFSDYSLQPNVTLALRKVQGSVTDLSSERLRHAVVNLGAEVGAAGPVTITGIINPLHAAETNELTISVKDVDLTPASPYAGRFAGYGIEEGKLSLDLHYELTGKKLAAKNVIRLDQFAFGEKVNSAEATHLPVRLAVAILKDREGKIVLNVPIAGSLDDPKFQVGKVVTRAVMNILEKVATSPFSLLGAAFGGGGEEMGWQDFPAGSAELSAGEEKKLDALAKALHERPSLRLEIGGSIDPEGDREGLQRVALDREMRLRKWSKLRRSEQATNSVAQVVLSAGDRARYIEKFAAEAFSAKKITPEMIAANTNLAAYAAEAKARTAAPKKGAALLTKHGGNAAAPIGFRSKLVPPPDPVEGLLLATYPVSDADFQVLANRRAEAVQAYLLQTGKVEAVRLFLVSSGAGGLRRDGSRSYLQFR